MPEGASGPIPWHRPKKLIAELAPSHTHPDHVGNVDLFPQSMLLIQKAEWDWHFATPNTVFEADRPVTKLDGDYDVFGDGSVRLISTPGHTPGHESLLVDLPKTGYVLLSGDAVHFRSNWENRRVPAGNTDTAQSSTRKYAPEFYD